MRFPVVRALINLIRGQHGDIRKFNAFTDLKELCSKDQDPDKFLSVYADFLQEQLDYGWDFDVPNVCQWEVQCRSVPAGVEGCGAPAPYRVFWFGSQDNYKDEGMCLCEDHFALLQMKDTQVQSEDEELHLDAIEESGVYQRASGGCLDCLICEARLVAAYPPIVRNHERTTKHRAAQARISSRVLFEYQILRFRAHIYRALRTECVTDGEISAYNHCLQLLHNLEFSSGGPDLFNPPTEWILKHLREKVAIFRQEANMSAKPQAADAFSSILQLIDEHSERLFSLTCADHKDELRDQLENFLHREPHLFNPPHTAKLLDGIMSIIAGEKNENPKDVL